MNRAAVVLLAGALASCTYDFDKLLRDCADGGKCPGADGGTGGGSVGGGGGSSGGGSATGGGGSTGGGSAGGGGGSSGGGAGGGAPYFPVGPCFMNTCWENPLPVGEDLTAVWGSGPDDVWVGGRANLLLHWDGGSWARSDVLPDGLADDAILGIAGPGVEYGLYASRRNHTLLGYRGYWSTVDSPPPDTGGALATRIIANADVTWMANYHGVLWRRYSMFWSSEASVNTVFSVSVDPSGGAWFSHNDMGDHLSHLAFDGGQRLDIALSTVPNAIGPAVSVIALDDGGVIWLDSDWHLFQSDLDGGSLLLSAVASNGASTAASMLPSGDGFIVGGKLAAGRVSDGGITAAPLAAGLPVNHFDLRAVWTSPGLEGSWAVGFGGAMLRYTANQFEYRTRGENTQIWAIAATPRLTVAGGIDSEILLVRDGGVWVSQANEIVAGSAFLAECAAASPDQQRVCVGGPDAVRCFGPKPWQFQSTAGETMRGLEVLDDGGVIIATGNGRVLLRNSADGVDPLSADSSRQLLAVVARPDGELWAAGTATGNQAIVLHRWADGGEATSVVGAGTLNAAWLDPSGSTVVVAGDVNGAPDVLASDGGSWTSFFDVSSPMTTSITALAGPDYDDLWAVGTAGTLYHHQTSGWTPIETGTRVDFHALSWQRNGGGGELWLGGDNGAILHYGY